MIKNVSCGDDYISNISRSNLNTNLILTKNKFFVEISQDDTEDMISSHIKSGIFNFGLDLFFGSIQQNLRVIELLKNASNKESEFLGFSIPLSVYLKLSPRHHYTGRFKRKKGEVNLKLHGKVILTTNREYASASCHSFIYVNAKFLIGDVRKCDIICLGKYIQLQVVEVQSEHLICKVIVGGLVKPRMSVRFPNYIEEAHSKISAEELEDITFAMGVNINVIVSYAPENIEYCTELRDTLALLECNHFYLFTRLTLSSLESSEDAQWISKAYDGFLIDCSDTVCADNEIVKLSLVAQEFMENSYHKRKPIFLQGCWTNLVDPSDYRYAFKYPDKYVLPCGLKFLRLFEAIFHNLSKIEFSKKFFPNKTITLSSSSSLARSIAAASLDFQAEVIVISSTIGEMALKISHFRPKAVTVAITNLSSVVNYSSMHHNILMLSFDAKANNKTSLSHEEETYQNLIYGLRYALSRELIKSSDTVMLVFCKLMRCGSTDKFAAIKIDNDYAETIRNVISN